jgi:hypothetical protein
MADFYLMSRRKQRNQPGRQIWRRLGTKNIWGSGLFWFAAAIFGIFTFLMDFLRTANPSGLWFVTYFVSLAQAVGMAYLFRLVAKRLSSTRASAWLNILAAGLIGGFKNLTVAFLAVALGLETHVGYLYRFFGGMFMGSLILVTFAVATGARTEHALAVRTLQRIQYELLGARENLSLVLAEELDRLQTKSREAVLPKLELISSLMASEAGNEKMIAELRETANSRLRPLMDEISRAAAGQMTSNLDELAVKSKVSYPTKIAIGKSIRPVSLGIYLFGEWAFIEYYFAGLPGLANAFLVVSIYVIVLFLLKWLTSRLNAVRRFTGAAILLVVGFFALVPPLYVVGGSLPLDARLSVSLPVIMLTSGLLTFTVFTQLFILDDEREKLEARITAENQELSKEQAVFEQRLWVFRRSWLFMLHGTVQAALTAALTRLQTFTDNDPYQASLIRADLERAEKALRTVPNTDVDFSAAVEELKSAWKGVCAVFVDVDMRAERALQLNSGTAYCVNEIVKEAVGNAVRHGGATGVQVTISRIEDDVLDIRIQNDGKAVPKNFKKGIGSRMLDDITLEWRLESSGKLTTLSARLPI